MCRFRKRAWRWGKRAWRWRKRAWRGAIVKVARGNTITVTLPCNNCPPEQELLCFRILGNDCCRLFATEITGL